MGDLAAPAALANDAAELDAESAADEPPAENYVEPAAPAGNRAPFIQRLRPSGRVRELVPRPGRFGGRGQSL